MTRRKRRIYNTKLPVPDIIVREFGPIVMVPVPCIENKQWKYITMDITNEILSRKTIKSIILKYIRDNKLLDKHNLTIKPDAKIKRIFNITGNEKLNMTLYDFSCYIKKLYNNQKNNLSN